MDETQIKAIEEACLFMAMTDHPDLPSDAAAVLKLPDSLDPRMWVDIVSNEFYEKTAEEYRKRFLDDEPMGESVFDQYCFVSSGLL